MAVQLFGDNLGRILIGREIFDGLEAAGSSGGRGTLVPSCQYPVQEGGLAAALRFCCYEYLGRYESGLLMVE